MENSKVSTYQMTGGVKNETVHNSHAAYEILKHGEKWHDMRAGYYDTGNPLIGKIIDEVMRREGFGQLEQVHGIKTQKNADGTYVVDVGDDPEKLLRAEMQLALAGIALAGLGLAGLKMKNLDPKPIFDWLVKVRPHEIAGRAMAVAEEMGKAGGQ